MLDEARAREDEYEKQYFGFSSTEVYVNIKERTSNAVKMALTEVEMALTKEGGFNSSLQEQIITKFYCIYMQSAKLPLEEFEKEARKIFSIPKHVVLDEDQYKTDHVTDDDIMKMKKEVSKLETEFLRQQVFLAKCKQQKEIIDSKVEVTYEKVNNILKSLKKFPKDVKVDDKLKLLDNHKQFVQYYLNNKDIDTERFQPMSERFFEIKADFFDES